MINLNGVSHVMLTVGQYDKAREFYSRLMPALGLECAYAGSDMCLFVGGRIGIGIQPCKAEHVGKRSALGGVGMHYLSLRARAREDVEKAEALAKEAGASVVSPAREGFWAPGCSYVRFEDPDGIRIEVIHVPGQGILAEGVSFTPGDDWT